MTEIDGYARYEIFVGSCMPARNVCPHTRTHSIHADVVVVGANRMVSKPRSCNLYGADNTKLDSSLLLFEIWCRLLDDTKEQTNLACPKQAPSFALLFLILCRYRQDAWDLTAADDGQITLDEWYSFMDYLGDKNKVCPCMRAYVVSVLVCVWWFYLQN